MISGNSPLPADPISDSSALGRHVSFVDSNLERRWSGSRVPISHFYEAYFRGDIEIQDLDGFLADRARLVTYRLTLGHVWWGLTRFLPEVVVHSRRYDRKLVRDHYDRSDEFFSFFLGDSMVYSAGFFEDASDSIDKAQRMKLDRVCRKLQLKPGERLLDLGCGWGALAAHAADHYGAEVTGVTLSRNQAKLANERLASAGLASRARVLCVDYREIEAASFDKIASLEMIEHVGVRQLGRFLNQVGSLLDDNGVFLLQWTGLRRGLRREDLLWGLFMNRYIFPGADASLCPSAMLRETEKAGFEMHSSENVSIHYAYTIRAWRRNWLANREAVIDQFGDRWFRVWNFFLAWSGAIAEQGNAACMQTVLHKNLDDYDRYRWARPGGVRVA